MKFKSRHEIKYFLFFIAFMLYQHFRPPSYSGLVLFNAIDLIIALALVALIIYEILSRRRLNRAQGESVVFLTGSEISSLIIIIAAVVMTIAAAFNS